MFLDPLLTQIFALRQAVWYNLLENAIAKAVGDAASRTTAVRDNFAPKPCDEIYKANYYASQIYCLHKRGSLPPLSLSLSRSPYLPLSPLPFSFTHSSLSHSSPSPPSHIPLSPSLSFLPLRFSLSSLSLFLSTLSFFLSLSHALTLLSLSPHSSTTSSTVANSESRVRAYSL